MSTSDFYDDIAEFYDLIYADWEASMRRHGEAISQMLAGPKHPSGRAMRILDASAGIGTQALPLAELGFEVVARDLSPRAVARLSREASSRGLAMEIAEADMREVGRSVSGVFDAVIAFDNSVPHLLNDDEIRGVLRGMTELLAPGGSVFISVRDYDSVDRSPSSVHRHAETTRAGRTFRVHQEWSWHSRHHYRTTMVVEEAVGGSWRTMVRSDAEYYAVTIERLMQLMAEAGLRPEQVREPSFFQPVLRGRRPERG